MIFGASGLATAAGAAGAKTSGPELRRISCQSAHRQGTRQFRLSTVRFPATEVLGGDAVPPLRRLRLDVATAKKLNAWWYAKASAHCADAPAERNAVSIHSEPGSPRTLPPSRKPLRRMRLPQNQFTAHRSRLTFPHSRQRSIGPDGSGHIVDKQPGHQRPGQSIGARDVRP
jgi:hypothetical protein